MIDHGKSLAMSIGVADFFFDFIRSPGAMTLAIVHSSLATPFMSNKSVSLKIRFRGSLFAYLPDHRGSQDIKMCWRICFLLGPWYRNACDGKAHRLRPPEVLGK